MQNERVGLNKSLSKVDNSDARSLSTQVKNSSVHEDDDVIDPYFIWNLVKRYKGIVIGLPLGVALLTLLASSVLRPTFHADATVRINQNVALYNGAGSRAGSDWVSASTAIKLMLGPEVAEHVVKKLNLHTMPEFTGELRQRSIFPSLSGIKRALGIGSAREVNVNESISNAGGLLLSNLTIDEIEKTSLLRVRYGSFDPELSALVANEIADAFNVLDAKRKTDLSSSALDLLESERKQVQLRLQQSEKKLNQFSRKTGIVDLDDENNLMSARAVSLSKEFIDTQTERMRLEIQIEGAKQSSGLLSLPIINENASVIGMRAELTKLEADYADMAGVFRPEYPELIALKKRIELLKDSMNDEARRTFDGVVSKYKNAVESERVLRRELESNNSELLDLKDRSITFNLLKREWQSNKKLYDGLLEKVKSSGSAANLELARLSLVGVAKTPKIKSSPNIAKNVVVGGAGGMLLAFGLAFLLNLLDRRFRSITDLEEFTGIPALAVVPFIKNTSGLPVNHVAQLPIKEPSGMVGETFRSLRTSLTYSLPDQKLDTLMVTSAGPSEGKSTTIFNLGITLANSGSKVVLIDFDLRKPSVHKIIGKSRSPGLTDALINGSIALNNSVTENFHIITAGTATPNPAEMLESESCKNLITHLRKEFDVLLFDAPPVMGLADALIISQYSQNMLLAVDTEASNKDMVQSALKRLRRVNASMIGMVVTKYDSSKYNDYDYDASKYYYYYGDDEGGKKVESASGQSLVFKTENHENKNDNMAT